MATDQNKHAKELKRLAQYNKDAAGSYDTAAQNVGKSEYSTLFRQFQTQHAKFADELEAHATTLEGSPEEIEESSLGKVYQGWMNLKSSVSENDLDAMIAETKRMEDALIGQYEDAMEIDWTPELQQQIADQFAEIKEARNELQQHRRS